MDIVQLLTIFLIIILIVMIICEFVNRHCDETLWNIRYQFRPVKYGDYIVDAIGLTRSITYFWSSRTSNLNSHTDIILYSHNPNSKNPKFHYILIYTSHIGSKPLAETINDVNVKYHEYSDIVKVIPTDRFNFKLNGYKYRITEMHIPEKTWTVSEIYDIFKQLCQIPYHRLKFNCHHVCNLLLDVVLDTHVHKLNKYEFDNSENYKPLLYIYNYIKERLGHKVVDTDKLKSLRKIIKSIQF